MAAMKSSTLNESEAKQNSSRCLFLESVYFDKSNEILFISTIITAVINAIFGIVASCGNIIFIVSLLKTQSLRTLSNLLLGNLAISDLLVGIVVQPMYVVYKAGELNGRYECVVQLSFSTSAWLASGASFLTLTTISIERYIAIFKPFFYLTLTRERNAFAVSAFVWLFALILVFSRFAGLSSFLFYALSCSIIVVSFSTTTLIYVKIFRLAKRHQKSIDAQHHDPATHNESLVQETKVTKTIGLVTGLFFLSYFPTLFIMFYYSSQGYGLAVKTIYSWTDTVTFVSSSWNPFIYYMRNREIRQAILKTLKNIKVHVMQDSNLPPANVVFFSRKAETIKISKHPDQEIPPTPGVGGETSDRSRDQPRDSPSKVEDVEENQSTCNARQQLAAS